MPKLTEIEVSSVGEFIELADNLCHSDNEIRWFRCQQNASWSLQPSLWRNYSRDDEQNFTNRFRSRAALRRPSPPAEDDYSAWLSLMQHYGLPTRLLDWSRSPLIAAYFAVAAYRKAETFSDAAIWILKPHSLNRQNFGTDLTFPIDAKRIEPLLKPAFKGGEEKQNIVAVMAVEHDMRMFVQQGAFTIHSFQAPIDSAEDYMESLSRVIVRAANVEKFARQLYSCGFRRGDLFPDLANLADELRGLP